MKRLLLVISLFAATASVAAAHNTPHAWTVGKANVMLPDTVRITLPADLRASLEAELTPLIDRLRLLELAAQQERSDWLAAGTYANYLKRLTEARDRIAKGLPLDSAACAGTGKALSGKRYKHFKCNVTSYVLEVPAVEIAAAENGALPAIVEGPMRRYGPYEAVFTLHVTGPTRFVSQRLG